MIEKTTAMIQPNPYLEDALDWRHRESKSDQERAFRDDLSRRIMAACQESCIEHSLLAPTRGANEACMRAAEQIGFVLWSANSLLNKSE